MRAAIVMLALAGLAPPAAALCARTELVPSVITSPTAALPDDGGVLVGWESVAAQHTAATGDPSYRKDWTYGGAKVSLDPLAPGLTRYKPVQPGALTITDGKTRIGTFARDAKAAAVALPAPKLVGAELVIAPFHYGQPGQTLTLTFADPVPDTAVAVIAYATYGTSQMAKSFGRVAGGAKTAVVFTDAYRCTFNPPKTEAPTSRDALSYAFVDQFGRLSPQSGIVKLTVVDKMPKHKP